MSGGSLGELGWASGLPGVISERFAKVKRKFQRSEKQTTKLRGQVWEAAASETVLLSDLSPVFLLFLCMFFVLLVVRPLFDPHWFYNDSAVSSV